MPKAFGAWDFFGWKPASEKLISKKKWDKLYNASSLVVCAKKTERIMF